MHTIILWITILVMSLLSGCGISISNNEPIHMSNDEKALLKSIYVNEERIDTGDLLSHQEDTLNRYRCGTESLESKYPSYNFEIVTAEPATKLNNYANFTFVSDSSGDNKYSLYVYKDNNDEYYAEDNFYSFTYGKLVDDYMYDFIHNINEGTYGVKSKMTYVKGANFDENLTINDLNKVTFQLTVYTTDIDNDCIEELENAMRSDGLSCSCKIYETASVVDGLIDGTLDIKDYGYTDRFTFNTFDKVKEAY